MLSTAKRLADIPEYWRDKFCHCNRAFNELLYASVLNPYPPIDYSPHPKSGYPVCSECRKLRWEHLWECISCEEIFLRDFNHPGFDWKFPKCWECLERDDPDYICTNYPQGVIEINIQKGKRKGTVKKESEMLKLAQLPSVFSFR